MQYMALSTEFSLPLIRWSRRGFGFKYSAYKTVGDSGEVPACVQPLQSKPNRHGVGFLLHRS